MKSRVRSVMCQLDFADFKKHQDYESYESHADKMAERDSLKAQDMIAEVQKCHGDSVEGAIKRCVCAENAQRAVDTGWASCAFSDWGHGDGRGYGGGTTPFQTIDTPVLTVEFTPEQAQYLNMVCNHYHVGHTLAVCYMAIFEMERMGYHI